MAIDEVDFVNSLRDDDLNITTEQIRQRAYDIWDRHHRPEGHEMQFWLMAERELKADMVKRNENDRVV